ncbi:MAG: pentapeptide repeat-containing protein [Acidimicrobiales bacterium]
MTLQPTNPYYVAAQALSQQQVQAGTKVGDCVIVSFSKCPGTDLAGQYLQGAFLTYSDLTGGNLANANLILADLAFAQWNGVDLTGANLSATSTTKASFAGAHMGGSQWVLLAGSNTDFSNADLHGANFTSAGLTSSNFEGADLSGANLTLANLTGANLNGAKLDNAVFCKTVMPDGTIRNPQPSAEAAVNTCGQPKDAGERPLTIDDQNPYYPLALAYTAPFVETGSTVAGCTVAAHTTCSGKTSRARSWPARSYRSPQLGERTSPAPTSPRSSSLSPRPPVPTSAR